MPQSLALTIWMAVFLIPALTVYAGGPPKASPLLAGDPFPRCTEQTLTGKPLDLPAAAAGRPALVVFSFSRAAGKDASLWNERLSRDFPNAVNAYTIILLEAVPKLFRGKALSGIKSGMPLFIQDRTIVLYHDEDLWKQRLAVYDDSRAYVVLLDLGGHIRWNNSGAFSESEYARLKNELERLLPPRP
jgi:hypothetical protein